MNSEPGALRAAPHLERSPHGSGLSPLPAIVEARPAPTATILLVAAALLFIASMPLAWHHDVIPAAGYRLVRGINGASWLTVAAVLAIAFAARFLQRSPQLFGKLLVGMLTFFVLIGMFADYINWEDNAGVLNVAPYFGPGFYVALGGSGVLLLATVAAWRARL